MIQPKGFGKKYFTLAAIQAYSAQAALQSLTTKIESRHLIFANDDEIEENLEEDILLENSIATVTLQNASHCSCYYSAYSRCKIKTHPSQKSSLNNIQSLKPSNSPPLSTIDSFLHVKN